MTMKNKTEKKGARWDLKLPPFQRPEPGDSSRRSVKRAFPQHEVNNDTVIAGGRESPRLKDNHPTPPRPPPSPLQTPTGPDGAQSVDVSGAEQHRGAAGINKA